MDAQSIGIPGKWKAILKGETCQDIRSSINCYFGFGEEESFLIQVFDSEFGEYVVCIHFGTCICIVFT
jgi:hypothetical protein